MSASTRDLALGTRVRVYWSDDKSWYAGTVSAVTRTRGHKITYDKVVGKDDLVAWHDLAVELYPRCRWQRLHHWRQMRRGFGECRLASKTVFEIKTGTRRSYSEHRGQARVTSQAG